MFMDCMPFLLYLSTIETIKAANGLPIHVTHIQFNSYGNNGDKRFSSAAVDISEYINKVESEMGLPTVDPILQGTKRLADELKKI